MQTMRRSLAVAGACVAAVVPLLMSGAPAWAAAPPAAALTRIACHSTLDPATRSVSVVSIMRHRPGTRSLAVRFTLLEKRPGAAPKVVRAGDLGHWTTPSDRRLGRLPADVWKLRKAVFNVDAPAVYRFRVTFWWMGRDRVVLARQTLRTGRCAVRELRPDVLVRRVSVSSGGLAPGNDRYVAVIANRGRTPSGPFSVEFSPGAGSGAPQTVDIASLGPRTRTSVRFVGPACDPAAPPTVIADPTHAVDDYDRSNNALTVQCPAARASLD
jgi:hypothetical protein